MTATGMIMRSGLKARWEALLALYGDPWYNSDLSKQTTKELVEECATVGGANDRKEIGSALHTLTALIDLGQAPTHLSEETTRDITAYLHARNMADIEIVEGMIEVTVILDKYNVAGTFDRLVRVPGFDLPLIADLKTGASLDYSYQDFAVQLAAYSRGEFIYKQGTAEDGSQDIREPMPEVDQNWGLIFWLNAGTANVELILLDLNAGWEAFGHSMFARGWRNAKPYKPLVLPGDLEPALQASLDALPPQPLIPATSAISAPGGLEPAPEPIDSEQIDSYQPAPEPTPWITPVREWLQDRINKIGQHSEARKALGQDWPNIPTLHASNEHTPEQLDAIEKLLDGIERKFTIEFPPPKPDADAAGKIVALFPGSNLIQTTS
jgi:hypothetical protein